MPDEILKTVPNERRCQHMTESHILTLPACCPVSGNPQRGSTIEITYTPQGRLLEVAALRAYVDSFQGGKNLPDGDYIRSMEGAIQQITRDCTEALKATTTVTATLLIKPEQRMILLCTHTPTAATLDEIYRVLRGPI